MKIEYFMLGTVIVGILGTIIISYFDLYRNDRLRWHAADTRKRRVGYVLLAVLLVSWMLLFIGG